MMRDVVTGLPVLSQHSTTIDLRRGHDVTNGQSPVDDHDGPTTAPGSA